MERVVRASVGDRVVIPGRGAGEADRLGEIVEVRGRAGAPPYVVRWADGHESLCFADSRVIIGHSSSDLQPTS